MPDEIKQYTVQEKMMSFNNLLGALIFFTILEETFYFLRAYFLEQF